MALHVLTEVLMSLMRMCLHNYRHHERTGIPFIDQSIFCFPSHPADSYHTVCAAYTYLGINFPSQLHQLPAPPAQNVESPVAQPARRFSSYNSSVSVFLTTVLYILSGLLLDVIVRVHLPGVSFRAYSWPALLVMPALLIVIVILYVVNVVEH